MNPRLSDFQRIRFFTGAGLGPPEPNVRTERSWRDSVVVVYSHERALLHTRFVLDGPRMRVGRGADNEIVLAGDSASRHHARFERRDDAWWVVDAGSTNGTFVNDEQAWPARRLRNGDRVKVGATVFEYLGRPDLELQYLEAIHQADERRYAAREDASMSDEVETYDFDEERFDSLDYEDKQAWMRQLLLPIALVYAKGSSVTLPKHGFESFDRFFTLLSDTAVAKAVVESMNVDAAELNAAELFKVALEDEGENAVRERFVAEERNFDVEKRRAEALLGSQRYNVGVDWNHPEAIDAAAAPTISDALSPEGIRCCFGEAEFDTTGPVRENDATCYLPLGKLLYVSKLCEETIGSRE